ncbi:hypothetical protein KVF89_20260 [Nocardioides carbamazepini]|jgi:hypothetical protein|uniref:hypothetical protein n=1 Tax=Nocardioides carbamazepini TaxID=2854259 RepID=UPI002149C721|nr:hypothetical protein [Nocardioides carbamazepini]MCR1784886.1 hypothetical protein [Nocardioides carbamazepini]
MHSRLPVVRRVTEFDALVEHRLARLHREIDEARSRLADEPEIEILTHLCGVLAGLGDTLSRRGSA